MPSVDSEMVPTLPRRSRRSWRRTRSKSRLVVEPNPSRFSQKTVSRKRQTLRVPRKTLRRYRVWAKTSGELFALAPTRKSTRLAQRPGGE
jgi:hypothetical protein